MATGLAADVLAGEGQTPVQLRGVQAGTMLQLGIICVNDSTNLNNLVGFY